MKKLIAGYLFVFFSGIITAYFVSQLVLQKAYEQIAVVNGVQLNYLFVLEHSIQNIESAGKSDIQSIMENNCSLLELSVNGIRLGYYADETLLELSQEALLSKAEDILRSGSCE